MAKVTHTATGKKPTTIRTSPDTDLVSLSSERPQDATPEHSEGTQETPTSHGEGVKKGLLIRQPLDSAIKAQIADRLRENPLQNYSELATELDVSDDVVGRIAKKLESGEDALANKRVHSFRRQIGKSLPMSERVRVYAEIVKGEADAKGAFSQLSALKRVEELEGIVTRKEQREVADNSVPVLPPMFVLKDADVDIGVAIKIRSNKRQR